MRTPFYREGKIGSIPVCASFAIAFCEIYAFQITSINRLEVPADNNLITEYVPITRQFLSKETQLSNATIHDWYYAMKILMITHQMTQQIRRGATTTITTWLHDNLSHTPLLIEAAYLVDIATSLQIPLDPVSRQKVAQLLIRSQTPEGGYTEAKQYPPDVLTSYFAFILSHDLNIGNNAQSTSLQSWFTTQRSWNGYRMTEKTLADPFATAYSLALRDIINSANIDNAPR